MRAMVRYGEAPQRQKGTVRSPDYPSVSLPKALVAVEKLYRQDKFAVIDLSVAATHLGYAGLNGGSRPLLSAMRKFGLIEYVSGGLRITQDGKAVLLPRNEDEKRNVLRRLLFLPKAYDLLFDQYPDLVLPSDATVVAHLVRDRSFMEKAAKNFLKDVRESLDFVGLPDMAESASGLGDTIEEQPEIAAPTEPGIVIQSTSVAEDASLQRLIMPGSDVAILLPREWDAGTARRIERWLLNVVVPTVRFAVSEDEEE